MDRIVIGSNGDEFNDLIKEYNSLVDRIKDVSNKIMEFELKIVSVPKCEL